MEMVLSMNCPRGRRADAAGADQSWGRLQTTCSGACRRLHFRPGRAHADV